jgi:thiol-disulfide isomerase/thioredoxin
MTFSKKTKKYIFITLSLIMLFNLFTYSLQQNQKEGFKGRKELLLLHMEGCPHCVELMPKWKQFVKENNTSILPKDVERSNDKDNLADKYGVKGFPTILLLDENGVKFDKYNGDRTVAGLLEYCKKHN